MRAPERLSGRRVAAAPAALDAVAWPDGALVLRLAPDEAFVVGDGAVEVPGDPDAVVLDDCGVAALRLDAEEAPIVLAQHVRFPLPAARPALVSGAVAGLGARIRLEEDGSAVVIVAAPLAHELAERLA